MPPQGGVHFPGLTSSLWVTAETQNSKLETGRTNRLALQVEFTAAHEKLALRIRADKAAFLIDQFRAADRAELPPVF
jgi:hypothetical protein